jgi:hypothetical protein
MADDDWDARRLPLPRRPRVQRGWRQGLVLILAAVGIPLAAFFFQDEGALRFARSENVFERNITPTERREIKDAIDRYKARLDGIRKVVEEVKERYRAEIGEGYYSERWIVHSKAGFAIPFKYVLALGAVLALVGIGKLVL